MSIKNKIISSFLLLLILSLVAIIFVSFNIYYMKSNFENLTNEQFMGITVLLEADRDSYQSNVSLLQVMNAQSEEVIEKKIQEGVRENILQVKQRFDIFKTFLYKYMKNNETKFNEFDIFYNQTKGNTEKLIYLMQSNKNQEAKDFYFTTYLTQYQQMRDTLDYFTAETYKVIDTNKKHTDSLISLSFTIFVIVAIVTLFITIALSYIFTKTINKSIESFQLGVLNFFKFINKETDTIALFDDSKKDEFGQMAKVLNESLLILAHDVTERKNIEKRIGYMAHYDTLTDLPNRILANNRAEQAIFHAKHAGEKVAILFIDLDEFKTINDSLGHSVGDEILKLVALRLQESIRASDVLSRQGGDEFILILPEINDINAIVEISETLIQAFKEPFDIDNQFISLSASIGIAVYPDHGDSVEFLLQSADVAMYKAKENGKNNYCFYTQQMNQNIARQFQIQNDLKKAIANSEFILHYQPQVDLEFNRITGAEALIRWRHPELGMVPPMDFIPIAESTGLIVPIGEWVLHEACRQAALWAKNGMEITVAVNISAVQVKRGNLEAVVKKVLSTCGLTPKFLELELTESVMVHDVENILKTVQALKALGIQLSIDDFGTGYSSLSYLKRFAVDKLKIDQSFVRDILIDKEDKAIVKTIIQMAKNLNLKTIAEGVEDEHVLDVVRSLGCDEVQGYHFAKPMEPADFEKFQREFI